jgi:hypothetical protein
MKILKKLSSLVLGLVFGLMLVRITEPFEFARLIKEQLEINTQALS